MSDDPPQEENMEEEGSDSEEGEHLEVIDLDELLGDPDDEEWEEEGEGPAEGDAEPEQDLDAVFPGIAVVQPKVSFCGHQGSVFCVAAGDVEGQSVAVSGGEDDKAFVWNTSDASIRFVCEGHKDSVVHTGVSHDAAYLFSADMAGVIKVWNISNGEEVWSGEAAEPKWVKWHPKAHVLIAATEDGSLYMWQIPQGQCKVYQASGAITAAEFFPDGKRLAFGHGSGTVSILDLKEWKILFNFARKHGQEDEVLCIDIDAQGTLMATGNLSGSVRVLHSLTGKVIKDIDDPAFKNCPEDERAIESVAFSKNHPWLAVAGLNGVFSIYDIPTQTVRHTCSRAGLKGITKMAWLASTDLLMVGHLNGLLSLWDSKTGQLQRIFKCQRDEVLDLVVTLDGGRALAACDNADVYVFDL
ncbi:Angio-associated migratory cell protein [Hypsibius exemplaris]|uniref:Angio-associated migratory cell protein n=1 Tax=Hypsibius exemplaris TaxID=2072580 RepID=A0A1W0WDR6_HYPEX|nr:Angio-associated migratory cell protein [Hypsibius exemplaris]